MKYTTKCKTCGKDILFIETPAGKKMPCDFVPVYYFPDEKVTGKFVTEDGEVVSGARISNNLVDKDRHKIGYVPHWANCNNPAAHRKSR